MLTALFRWAVALAVVGAIAFWWITRPSTVDPDVVAALTADIAHGEQVFHAAGCASCHAAPGATGEDKLVLSGGQRFESPFGTFIAPNISSDPDQGIGGWSAEDLVNAVINGVSPGGSHYFPAFPYASYAKAKVEDIVALHGFMQTLPASDVASQPHEVSFPFNIRRNLGGWKWLYVDDSWVLDGDLTPEEERGRYLVEALGHCAECHTARDPLGGLDRAAWMGGAPNPSGKGRIPNITPAELLWSEEEIAEYLTSGFTPEFDTVGGHMVDVVENTAKLPPEDRLAIAAYLKRVPQIPNP